jgi:hypothetical protein
VFAANFQTLAIRRHERNAAQVGEEFPDDLALVNEGDDAILLEA